MANSTPFALLHMSSGIERLVSIWDLRMKESVILFFPPSNPCIYGTYIKHNMTS